MRLAGLGMESREVRVGMGTEFPFGKMKKVLEVSSGEGEVTV